MSDHTLYLGAAVEAYDGTVGEIASLPFDDENGQQRYMVACREGLVSFLSEGLSPRTEDEP